MDFLAFRKIAKKYYLKTFIVFVGVAILVLFGIYLANDFWEGTTLIYERQELVENNVATVILYPEEPDTLVEVVPDNSLEEKTPIITKSEPVVIKPTPVKPKSKLKPTIKSTPTPAPVPVSTPVPVVPEPVPVALVVPDVPVVPVPVIVPDILVAPQIIFPGGSGGSGGGGGGGSPPPAPDTTAPVITLTGVDPQIIEVGIAYSELGATVTDNLDVGLTATINAAAVNTTVVGSYSVTYNVSDASGNPAIQKTRTINVIEPAGPPEPPPEV